MYCALCKTHFWAVRCDLTLSPLQLDRMPGTRQVVFDYKGERALFARSDRLTVWDLARNQVLKLLNVELGYGGVTATLSPDGRWLAAIIGSRDAPVVVWDLNRADATDPASSLHAVCNLEESECIRRLCEKFPQPSTNRTCANSSAMRPLTSLTAQSEQPVVNASTVALGWRDWSSCR